MFRNLRELLSLQNFLNFFQSTIASAFKYFEYTSTLKLCNLVAEFFEEFLTDFTVRSNPGKSSIHLVFELLFENANWINVTFLTLK